MREMPRGLARRVGYATDCESDMLEKSVIIKRSVTVGGHKTSISLEAEFWNGLREIAALQNVTVTTLLQRIDTDRKSANLSSAVRIHVFEHYRKLAAERNPPQGGGVMATFVFDDMAITG
jgi:predicted DNA-binding ribbon-helix-helix protein